MAKRLLLLMLIALWGAPMATLAQDAVQGTIEALEQDNGFLVISGRRVGFSDQITHVFWEGAPLGAQWLNQGMVVRYTLNADGVLVRIDVLGPAPMLEEMRLN